MGEVWWQRLSPDAAAPSATTIYAIILAGLPS